MAGKTLGHRQTAMQMQDIWRTCESPRII